VRRRIAAEGTQAFNFTKPAGFNFCAGQSLKMAMRPMLEDMGVADDAMRYEELYGY
jgi:hypothetical protein